MSRALFCATGPGDPPAFGLAVLAEPDGTYTVQLVERFGPGAPGSCTTLGAPDLDAARALAYRLLDQLRAYGAGTVGINALLTGDP